jgi:hypothetical protein
LPACTALRDDLGAIDGLHGNHCGFILCTAPNHGEPDCEAEGKGQGQSSMHEQEVFELLEGVFV